MQNIRKATASRLAQKQHEIEQHSSIIEKLGVRSAPEKYFFRLLGRSRTKAAVLAGLFFLVLPLSIFYVVRPPLCNPYTTPSAGRVDRVGVKILALRRVRDQNATLVELDYRITTGAEFAWHNPASFVKLISNGVTLAPISASASARNLVSNSQDDFSAKFLVPTDKAAQVIFRFGEEHHLDLPACLMD